VRSGVDMLGHFFFSPTEKRRSLFQRRLEPVVQLIDAQLQPLILIHQRIARSARASCPDFLANPNSMDRIASIWQARLSVPR
jgi:hypothetical protein